MLVKQEKRKKKKRGGKSVGKMGVVGCRKLKGGKSVRGKKIWSQGKRKEREGVQREGKQLVLWTKKPHSPERRGNLDQFIFDRKSA